VIASVTADPNRTGVVYAAVFNNLANGAIRKSIDGGVTWATIFPTTAPIFNITIDPGNSDILLCPDRWARRLQEHGWRPTLIGRAPAVTTDLAGKRLLHQLENLFE